MRKKYMRHIFPAMLSFLLTGIYSIVDGIFIGKSMGDMGLAAINIAWPLVSLMISMGTGIGMGAAVVASIHRGSGDVKKALQAEGNAFVLLLAGSLLLALFLSLFGVSLLGLLGAEGELLPMASTYLRYILLGSVIQIFACGSVPLLRIHEASVYAMLAMALGCISNIFLDYLFVLRWNWELKGAALATVFGQGITFLLCLLFYLQKNRLPLANFRPDRGTIRSILPVAASPFGLTFLPSITIIFMNLQSLRYGGEEAVSAYAVLAYLISFMELFVQGIGDGSQPLFSLSLGSAAYGNLKLYARWTFSLSISISLTGGVLFYLLRHNIPDFYGISAEAAGYIEYAAPAFALIIVLYGLTKPAVSYFYATHRIFFSSFLVYGEILLTALLIFILPLIWGIAGVWYTIPITQLLLGICCIFFLKKGRIITAASTPTEAKQP